MTLPASRRLSALIVNYKSGAFALACVESLRREWCRTRVGLDLEIVVCDNASPGDPEPELRELARRGVKVVRNAENVGFAGGIQRALRETQGGPRDVVAVLNPDVVFLPGSIDPLMDYLEQHDACGVCGPRAFLDPDGRILLPRIERPTPFSELAAAGGRALPRLARRTAARRTVRTRAFWEATVPFATRMLSGACLFLRRETFARAGGLLDTGYPLYYEDADLCERVRAAGFELRLIPDSRIVHHWARSSGAGDEAPDWPADWWARSRARYLSHHFGRPSRFGVELGERALHLWPSARRDRPIHALTDLGALDGPPWVELGGPTRFVIEIAMAPTFPLAAGLYGVGSGWTIDPGAWEWLFGGRYFARAIDISGVTGSGRDGDVLGAWTFVKTTHARVEPWRSSEIASELADVLPDEIPLAQVEGALPAPYAAPPAEVWPSTVEPAHEGAGAVPAGPPGSVSSAPADPAAWGGPVTATTSPWMETGGGPEAAAYPDPASAGNAPPTGGSWLDAVDGLDGFDDNGTGASPSPWNGDSR